MCPQPSHRAFHLSDNSILLRTSVGVFMHSMTAPCDDVCSEISISQVHKRHRERRLGSRGEGEDLIQHFGRDIEQFGFLDVCPS